MLRQGTGPPIVLLHGLTSSEHIWRPVVPRLADRYDVIAFTALGHRGGHPTRPGIGMTDVVDDAERFLDELGLERPHLVGNSMGGWVALELARRGRAASVCALSPGGLWGPTSTERRRALAKIRVGAAVSRLFRWVLPFVARFALVRRIGLRDAARRGDRLTPQEFVAFVDDILGCDARHDLLRMADELAPFESSPCPITVAWAEHDRLLPLAAHRDAVRRVLPDARWLVLPDVGHVPMIDDPQLVVDTIVRSIPG